MKFNYYDWGVEVAIGRLTPVWVRPTFLHLMLFITFPLWIWFDNAHLLTALLVMIGAVLSILAHEICHIWAAQHFGQRPILIRLHGAGGEAIWETYRATRGHERLIILAGPMVNLLIGLACLLLYHLFFGQPSPATAGAADSLWQVPPPVVEPVFNKALHWLGVLNLVWTAVNLLPAFPLDGGKLAYSLIEARYGSLRANFLVGISGTTLSLLAKLAFFVGIFAGMAIWLPVAFMPNYNALKSARRTKPVVVR